MEFTKDNLFSKLKDLRELPERTGVKARRKNDNKVEQALDLIYLAHIRQIDFTAEEKEVIAASVAKGINHINANVITSRYISFCGVNSNVLVKRSTIQFLIDNFGEFASNGQSIAKLLQESVEILDDYIDNNMQSDDNESSSDRNAAGSPKVPASHTWWLKHQPPVGKSRVIRRNLF